MIDIIIMLLALWLTNGQMQDVSSDLGMSPPPGPSWSPLQAQEGVPAAVQQSVYAESLAQGSSGFILYLAFHAFCHFFQLQYLRHVLY